MFRNIAPMKTNATAINDALKARVPVSDYKVVPGDKISINMQELMEVMEGPGYARTGSIERRVRTDGTISLPKLDEDVKVAGMTMLEVEQAIETAYWPAFVVKRPAIVADIEDYSGIYVEVSGRGIDTPGIYMLRSDMQSLSSLLSQAGGIHRDHGADKIVITPAEDGAEDIVVTVSTDGTLSDDVHLAGGERVAVYPMASSAITIIGQCNRPGRYPISPDNPPSLIEALGQAGGVREVEDPRYVSVYRRDADDKVVSATFRLNENGGLGYANLLHDDELGDGAFATLQSGDVVVLERTFRSRTRQFLSQVVRLSVGASAATSATYHEDLRDSGSGRTDVTNYNTTNVTPTAP